MKKKKILIIQGYGFQRGGAVTFLRYIVNLIDKRKFKPIILFLSKGELVDEFKKMSSKGGSASGGKLDVRVINSGRLLNIFSFILTIFRILYLIYKERVNIVFSNDGREHIYGGIAAYIRGIPATFLWHSFFSKSHLERLILLIPSTLLSYNNETKRAVESYGYGQKVILIHPGIELPNVGAYCNTLLQVGGITSSPYPVITQPSLLMDWKGQKYFIKAAASVINTSPNTKFLIVGNTPCWLPMSYEESLYKLVKELKLEQSVIFMGYQKNISEIMYISDVIVHPVVGPEPFGFVVIEAMGAGKPVIASNIGTPAKIIENGVDGILVPPKDSNAIAKAILTLLKDKELCKTIGDNARKKVATYFRADKMVKEIENLWLDLVLV